MFLAPKPNFFIATTQDFWEAGLIDSLTRPVTVDFWMVLTKHHTVANPIANKPSDE